VIKCSRCGNMNTTGALHCQSCGNALSSMDTSGNDSNMTSQEQSALPAWLESLRVGDRTSRPAANSPKLSTTDLVEEGSLPSWMHAQRDETQNVTGANLPVPLRSSSVPAPSTDGVASARSFAAQSLIDEQSLPPWMQGGEGSTSLPPESGISAAKLVDKDSMPDWMKSLPQQPPVVASPGQPEQTASTERAVKKVEQPSPSPDSGFAAQDLVDQQSLPAWMTQLGHQDPATFAGREQLMQSGSLSNSAVNERAQPIQPGQKEFAAQDLVDQQSLPTWMIPQSSQYAAAPTNGEQERQPSQPGASLPASSLLDMDALPSWLPERSQAQAVSPTYSQPPTSMDSSSPPWPVQEPAMQGYAADFSSIRDGHLEASSVIDKDALPEWLHSSSGQPSASEALSQSHSAPYVGPPRVENVRVPNRPRGEINSSETSEMAASVFASMLGVASSAPNFPAPTGASYQQQPGQLSYIEQMSLSGVSGMAGMPSQAGMSSVGMSNWGGASMAGGPGAQSMTGTGGRLGAQSMVGVAGGPGAQSMAGVAGGPGAQSMVGNVYGSYQDNASMGKPAMQTSQYSPTARNLAGELNGPGAPTMVGGEKNTKKRGLFGALLDWLSR
jgi:hypothetical protein